MRICRASARGQAVPVGSGAGGMEGDYMRRRFEKAEKFLSRGIELEERIRHAEELAAILEDQTTRTTAELSGMPRGGPREGNSAMENAAVSLMVLREDIAARRKELHRARKEILEMIRGIGDPRAEEILTDRFIMDWPFDRIIERTYLSRTTVFDAYRRGMEDVENRI